MKLWLLRPRDDLPEDNPWEPWYDKAFGFVVCAESEQKARELATSKAGNEDEEYNIANGIDIGIGAWLNPEYSTCIELTPGDEPRVIMCDFHYA